MKGTLCFPWISDALDSLASAFRPEGFIPTVTIPFNWMLLYGKDSVNVYSANMA